MGIYEDRLAFGASIEWALSVFCTSPCLVYFSAVATWYQPVKSLHQYWWGQEVQHKEWYRYNLTWCMLRDAERDISFLTVVMIRNSSNYLGGVMLDSCVKGWKPFFVRSAVLSRWFKLSALLRQLKLDWSQWGTELTCRSPSFWKNVNRCNHSCQTWENTLLGMTSLHWLQLVSYEK